MHVRLSWLMLEGKLLFSLLIFVWGNMCSKTGEMFVHKKKFYFRAAIQWNELTSFIR